MERLRLLMLEDMISDAELVLRTLERSGLNFEVKLTHNESDFVRALDEHRFDAILADNSLPQFSATEALAIINERRIDIPFILVTGSISEEYAVMILKKGAWDYILKDRLQRLPASIVNAIEKYRLDRERRRYLDEVIANEALLKEAARLARFGSWQLNMVTNEMRWADEKYHILGCRPGEDPPTIATFLSRVHPDDLQFVKQKLTDTLDHLDHNKFYCRILRNDEIKHIYAELAVKRREDRTAISANGFIIDVSDLKEAELKEKKIAADLVQRNNDLEQFAYIISHNLRSPVANIVGVSNALIAGDLNEEEQTDFMNALSHSVQKLDEVILDLNHILEVRNNISESREWVSFAALVESAKVNLAGMLEGTNVTIRTDFSSVDRILTIKSYVYSIFYNLISNSIKFRRAGVEPIIEISSAREHDRVIVTFKDNGIGIDLNNRSNHVFGLYKRFHPQYAEGKGMGLFMVKTHAEILGGKVTVKSAVDVGSEFRIELNLAEQDN